MDQADEGNDAVDDQDFLFAGIHREHLLSWIDYVNNDQSLIKSAR
jgi:hypothetical protein